MEMFDGFVCWSVNVKYTTWKLVFYGILKPKPYITVQGQNSVTNYTYFKSEFFEIFWVQIHNLFVSKKTTLFSAGKFGEKGKKVFK